MSISKEKYAGPSPHDPWRLLGRPPPSPGLPCTVPSIAHLGGVGPKFGIWEDLPVRWAPGEAWAFIDGERKRVDSSDIGFNGREIDEESFATLFASSRLCRRSRSKPVPTSEAPHLGWALVSTPNWPRPVLGQEMIGLHGCWQRHVL